MKNLFNQNNYVRFKCRIHLFILDNHDLDFDLFRKENGDTPIGRIQLLVLFSGFPAGTEYEKYAQQELEDQIDFVSKRLEKFSDLWSAHPQTEAFRFSIRLS